MSPTNTQDAMAAALADAEFRWPWRDYQARVLGELGQHLDDNRLHIVAAPGSGKTVLGLEVMRLLARPTLILAPTLTVRNQWIDRFVNLFLPPGAECPDWISTDIRDPRLLTVATYQALHAASTGCGEKTEEDPEDDDDTSADQGGAPLAQANNSAVRALRAAGIGTIIVDEAHHLRREWWTSLQRLRDHLSDATLVALTATPPLDVPPIEWDRYRRLCGPVDAEVSVPELVKKGDLCPHQDYVYLSLPTATEAAQIREFRQAVEQFRQAIVADGAFLSAVEAHPWVADPEAHLEELLAEPADFSAMVIFINAARGSVPENLLDILGVRGARLPALTLEWLEPLLQRMLYTDAELLADRGTTLEGVRRALSGIGAVRRRRVNLRNPESITRLLGRSVGKLDGIAQIVRHEAAVLGDKLRLSVLADYIYPGMMPGPDGVAPGPPRLGVVPIFERLRQECPESVRLGVLTGSLVIIPGSAEGALRDAAERDGISETALCLKPLAHDPRYVSVGMVGGHERRLVRLMTRLFDAGAVSVLVGTAALLGEGWDAPSINSLVLASSVASYMLSNQMRGRAIRTQALNPGKTANIWHLACIEPGSINPGEDMASLARRFEAFVGVSPDDTLICSGIERLGLGEPPYTVESVAETNARVALQAADRWALRHRWQVALDAGDRFQRVVTEVKADPASLPRGFILGQTISALAIQAVTTGTAVFFGGLRLGVEAASYGAGPATVLTILAGAAGLGAAIAIPGTVKALWLAYRHGPVASSIRQIGRVVLESLSHAGAIKTPLKTLKVNARTFRNGGVHCSLTGGTTYETSAFLDAMQELLDPVENPRYLLLRRDTLRRGAIDYHAVPTLIGRNGDDARYFAARWRKAVGRCELAYTRNPEGRKTLLKARTEALSAAFVPRSRRVSIWR
ncbi:MAG TPA: hypothetical protein DGT21_04675 [Armatimonadetes bacterium]|jgi:superfamily II DNA or RNA helicase|nr:hypothetical protein [Armatimonadota bacterium]